MDCRTARSLLDFVRPQTAELSAEDAEGLGEHLHECPECGLLARVEREADERLSRAMRDLAVPHDLRARLLNRLGAERRSWYRGLARRHPRVAVAVAASVLLLLGTGIYWATKAKPVIELEGVLAWANERNERRSAGPEEIERWFAEGGVKTKLPPDFNYYLLDSFAQESFQGRLVPRLLFIRGQNRAYVYILSASQFDLKRSLQQPPQGSGGYTVEIRAHLENPDVAYLILYTGDSLEPFLGTEQRPAA
jgi:hypothetical protein